MYIKISHNHRKTLSIFVILFTFVAIGCAQQWYEHGNPHFINEQDYERLVINPQTRNKGVTMLKFFTPWCRYCKYLKDIIDMLKARDTWSITMYEVNCDGQNHHFCGKMGVHSFPKMKVFEDGNPMENMDGFYPYQVVRELFLKYNRTSPKTQTVVPAAETVKEQPHKEEVKTQDHNSVPVVPMQKYIQQRPQQVHQQGNAQKKEQVPLPHVEEAKPQQKKTQQHQQQQLKSQQHPTTQEKSKHPSQLQKSELSSPQKKEIPQTKKPQQMIEQEENIAVVDSDKKQAQKQKRIIEEMNSKGQQVVDTVDLRKIPFGGQEHVQYGKYIVYGICILVGGYYFVNIMKGDLPNNQQAKGYNSSSSNYSNSTHHPPSLSTINRSNPSCYIPPQQSKVSIEDSQLREQLDFEHPNQQQQQMNLNEIEVRDEDL